MKGVYVAGQHGATHGLQLKLRGRAVLVGAALLLCLNATAAVAQSNQLSEASARKFMEYAWTLVPARFTPPNGKTITIDKSDRASIMVPLDVAREIIRVGRMSAHAQHCDLIDDQVLNYRSLMRREQLKGKWTPQQMVYISQLHLTTVMLLTGQVKIVENQAGKEVVVDESAAKTVTCSAEQKEKVVARIQAYVKAGPLARTKSAGSNAATATTQR
ncbi:MAG: hypothetical protein AAGG72_01755 [Pseudomonadota bacterium]